MSPTCTMSNSFDYIRTRDEISKMVHTILVADSDEIQKLAEGLPLMTSGFYEGEEQSNKERFVPIFTTGRAQLVLVQNGNPILAYKVPASPANEQGTAAIFGFIERLKGNKHLVMLYDDPRLARQIEFLYIKQGLEKGKEHCMYILPEDDNETVDSIRKQMDEYGIDTLRCLSNGSLEILKIDDPSKDKDGFKSGCVKKLDYLSARSKKAPLKVVLHIRYRFNTKDEIDTHAEFENMIQSYFERADFNGSMLCNHYIGHNEEKEHGEWTKRMIETHDNVFFVSSLSKLSPVL